MGMHGADLPKRLGAFSGETCRKSLRSPLEEISPTKVFDLVTLSPQGDSQVRLLKLQRAGGWCLPALPPAWAPGLGPLPSPQLQTQGPTTTLLVGRVPLASLLGCLSPKPTPSSRLVCARPSTCTQEPTGGCPRGQKNPSSQRPSSTWLPRAPERRFPFTPRPSPSALGCFWSRTLARPPDRWESGAPGELGPQQRALEEVWSLRSRPEGGEGAAHQCS